jgi:hypothetical protein
MKRLWVIPILFLSLALIGCGDTSTIPENTALAWGTEVLPNVFDDNEGTLYIHVDNRDIEQVDIREQADTAIANIMTKKREWDKQFPNKKVVAMSIVTGNKGGFGQPIVAGLLIHYEFEPPQIQTNVEDWETKAAMSQEKLQEIMEIITQSKRTP